MIRGGGISQTVLLGHVWEEWISETRESKSKSGIGVLDYYAQRLRYHMVKEHRSGYTRVISHLKLEGSGV